MERWPGELFDLRGFVDGRQDRRFCWPRGVARTSNLFSFTHLGQSRLFEEKGLQVERSRPQKVIRCQQDAVNEKATSSDDADEQSQD